MMPRKSLTFTFWLETSAHHTPRTPFTDPIRPPSRRLVMTGFPTAKRRARTQDTLNNNCYHLRRGFAPNALSAAALANTVPLAGPVSVPSTHKLNTSGYKPTPTPGPILAGAVLYKTPQDPDGSDSRRHRLLARKARKRSRRVAVSRTLWFREEDERSRL